MNGDQKDLIKEDSEFISLTEAVQELCRDDLKKDLIETFKNFHGKEWLNGKAFVFILTRTGIDKDLSIKLVRMFFNNYYDNIYDDLDYSEEIDAIMTEIAYDWSTILQEDDYLRIKTAFKESYSMKRHIVDY